MKKDLNLLPREVAIRRERDTTPFVNLLIVVGIIAVAYFVPFQMYLKHSLETEKTEKTAEYNALATPEVLADIERLNVIESELKRDATLEGVVNKNEMGYKEVLNAIEVSIPSNVKIQAISMSSDSEDILITAVAPDQFGLTDFWHNLRNTNIFDSVETDGYTSEESEDGAVNSVICNITLKYVQKG